MMRSEGPGLHGYLTEMKQGKQCLDFVLDLWPVDHFKLEFFASRKGPSELECTAFLLGVGNHRSDNSLKWPQIIKRGKRTTSSTP